MANVPLASYLELNRAQVKQKEAFAQEIELALGLKGKSSPKAVETISRVCWGGDDKEGWWISYVVSTREFDRTMRVPLTWRLSRFSSKLKDLKQEFDDQDKALRESYP